MKKKLLVISALSFLVCSCGQPQQSSSASEESSATSSSSVTPVDTFTTKTINAYYVNNAYNTTVDLRFYNQSVIPYISLKDYQQLLYRGRDIPQGRNRFDVAVNNGVYTCTVDGGFTATFDVNTNKIESDDLWNFKNTNLVGAGDSYAVSYDGMPFIKVKSAVFDKPSKKTAIDLGKYGMKMFGDGNSLYVPLAFASDLFTNENILQGAYNGKDLYITNFTARESVDSFRAQYYDPIFENPINKEYAEYVYNELCLDYDVFLGRTGRSSLERYYDLSNGLDAALQSRPLGKTIANYLKSTDLAEFLAGATLLGDLREDGGHSGYSPLYTAYINEQGDQFKEPAWLTKEVFEKAKAIFATEEGKNYEEHVDYDRGFDEKELALEARHEKLGKSADSLKGTETYTKDGDVAYIHIDGFMGELNLQNEWKEYYSGERDEIPFGDDAGGAVGAIHYGLTEAAKDSEIKHLVIDLSVNGGGSTDEMLFVVGILTGANGFHVRNTFTGRTANATYEFDFNFDKVFDEKDEQLRQQLLQGKDVSVLTTKNGFSCGGISPIYLHDEGVFTIGEECGGGSCAVYVQYDGYGNSNRASSPSMTITKAGESIDLARKTVCDAKLTFPAKEQGRDYSALFDTAGLRTLINAHYKK